MDDDELVLLPERPQSAPVVPAPEDPPPEDTAREDTAREDTAREDTARDDPAPDDPASPEPADVAGPGAGTLEGIHGELVALRSETSRVNAILDRMHAENEVLRRGEAEQILQPIFRDLMKLADDWSGMARTWSARESATPADVARKCEEMADDADLILGRHGVEGFSAEPGEAFERRRHRAVGTTPTGDAALDGTVASTRRSGYYSGEKVLRFAEVVLHAYAPAPEAPQPS